LKPIRRSSRISMVGQPRLSTKVDRSRSWSL